MKRTRRGKSATPSIREAPRAAPAAAAPAPSPVRESPLISGSPGAITLDGPMFPQPLKTASEIANYMNISRKTLGRLVRSGALPAVRIGDAYRFDLNVVRKKLNGSR